MPEQFKQFDFSKPEDQKEVEMLSDDKKAEIKKTAEDEAEKMQEKIESGKAIDYNEAKKLVEKEKMEKEFSPEIVEKIMGKVQDINKNGVAFTAINTFGNRDADLGLTVEKIFSNGLLGTSYEWVENDNDVSSKLTKNLWAEKTKEHKNSVIHFNIAGRMTEENMEDPRYQGFPIATSHWVRTTRNNSVSILFDLDKFKEENPVQGRSVKEKLKTRTFRANVGYFDPSYFEKHPFKKGESATLSEGGFLLSHRVAPRLFTGVCLGFARKGKTEKEDEDFLNKKMDNKSFLSKQEDTIVEIIKSCKNDPHKLVPIYDIYGNLHWPKYMPYEEVKKFVAERDKNKKEEKESE